MSDENIMDDVVAVHIQKCPRVLWQWAKSLAALRNQTVAAFCIEAVEAQCIREEQARRQQIREAVVVNSCPAAHRRRCDDCQRLLRNKRARDRARAKVRGAA